jgi:hypothetical protein
LKLELADAQLIGGELALRWSDGVESYLPLEMLRRACPCASCGGEPDVLGNILRPHVSYTAQSFELHGWEIVAVMRFNRGGATVTAPGFILSNICAAWPEPVDEAVTLRSARK